MLFLVPVVLPESVCDSHGLGEICLYCSDPTHSLPSVKYAHFGIHLCIFSPNSLAQFMVNVYEERIFTRGKLGYHPPLCVLCVRFGFNLEEFKTF